MTRNPRAAGDARLAALLGVSLAAHAALATVVGGRPAPATAAAAPAALTVQLATASVVPAPSSADRAHADAGAPADRPGRAGTALAPPVPVPHYYPAAQLDRRPQPLAPVLLPEPGGDVAGGYLVLRLRIDEGGRVDEALSLVAEGDAALARAVAATFARTRYAPGMRAGQAVKSELVIEVVIAPPAG